MAAEEEAGGDKGSNEKDGRESVQCTTERGAEAGDTTREQRGRFIYSHDTKPLVSDVVKSEMIGISEFTRVGRKIRMGIL